MIRCMGVIRDGAISKDAGTEGLTLTIPGSDGVEATLQRLRGAPRAGTTDFVWLSLTDPTAAETAMVGKVFALNPLLVDDAQSINQRPKVEIDEGGNVFVLLKALDWIDETSDVETGQVAVFVGPSYAVTVRHGVTIEPTAVRARLQEHPELSATGPLALLWAVLDLIVDGYLAVGDAIQDDVEEIEQQVFSPRPADAATRIYRLNRENIEMRRAVRPLVPAAQRLVRDQVGQVPGPLRPYLRDLGDHILRASDIVDGFDSTLMTMLMASTARQDLMQNNDMRKISAWAAIIAVPTAIAGIYGMNFDDMPELHWVFGYPLTIGVMALICFVLYRGFKRSGWL